MTVTDFIGKIFSFLCAVAGIFFGYRLYGIKGAAGGIVIGYVGGSILYFFGLYFFMLIKDSKKKKAATDEKA